MTAKTLAPTLEELWRSPPGSSLSCCVCGCSISEPTQTLIRTFALESQLKECNSREESSSTKFSKRTLWHRLAQKMSRRILVPEENDALVLFDRHATCMTGIMYITISHVWNREVAEVQCNRRQQQTDAQVEEARRLAFALPMEVYRVVAAAARRRDGEGETTATAVEIWHDYISVPQWQDEDKRKILLHMPRIYADAAYTMVHLDDVDAETLRLMRHGQTTRKRLIGIVKVCNSTWFSRVWTAMEFVQSRELRVMLGDGTLDDAGGDVFLDEMYRTYRREVPDDALAESLSADDRISLWPWMLGHLSLVRHDVKRRGSTHFALAFSLLSRRRRSTLERDFFYALLAIMPAEVQTDDLLSDPQRVFLRLAKAHMSRGDYSPLLMVPEWARKADLEGNLEIIGFNDLKSWELGWLVSPATFQDGITIRGDTVALKCVEIGTVHFLRRFRYMDLTVEDPTEVLSFAYISRLALDFTGTDTDAFVETVGGRLYGQNPQAIFDRLAHENRYEHVKHLLTLRYNSPTEEPWSKHSIRWIADAMGLSTTQLEGGMRNVSPLKFVRHHGALIHLRERAAIVGITCSTCHGRFLYRVAPYRNLSDTLGAVAYRIPGLRYSQTHVGGVAILVKDGYVVGRMVWATPACSCYQVRDVEVRMAELPLPAPNYYEYNNLKS
ncbi:hypothetical protein IWX91DRAFT_352906 [Phyllosticta citricarpa]